MNSDAGEHPPIGRMGMFMLVDEASVLHPEYFYAADRALLRASGVLWRAVPWRLFNPNGGLAAHGGAR